MEWKGGTIQRMADAYGHPAFKEMDAAHPLYGKFSDPPMIPAQWWTELIRRCMIHAGGEVEGESSRPALLYRQVFGLMQVPQRSGGVCPVWDRRC